jgi:hypothetical protein
MKRHIASVESQVLGEWISWRNIAITLIDRIMSARITNVQPNKGSGRRRP